MKILKDLGRVSIPTNKQKVHKVIAECPICKEGYETRLSSIKNGSSTKCSSCRYKNVKTNYKHGGVGTKLYNSWMAMRQRCYNKNTKSYQDYGAKGVKVCSEWKDSFKEFKKWAEKNGYKEGLTIDRINSNGNYTPDNCRWLTRKDNISRSAKRINYGNHGAIKLSHKHIKEIHKLLDKGMMQSLIAEKYNVSRALITLIKQERLNSIDGKTDNIDVNLHESTTNQVAKEVATEGMMP